MKFTKHQTGLAIGGVLAFAAVVLGWVEYVTLADDVPGNHITAVIQEAYRAEPGVFVLASAAFAFWMGHLFWGKR